MSNRIIISDVNPNDDLGAIIQQANDQLGNSHGEILVLCGGGNFRTPVNLSPKRYLYLGPGEYYHHIPIPDNPVLSNPMIFYDSDNTIEGAGWCTIFHENTDYVDYHACHIITPKPGLNPTNNLIIRNVKVQGHPENGGDGTGGSSIGADNVHNVQISGIYLQGTNAIGVSTGIPTPVDHGQNVFVTDCLFQDIPFTVALAAVNTRGFVFSRNIFRRCGNPIDLEANTDTDFESVWIISDNVIDSRGMTQQGEVAITVHGPLSVVDGDNDDGYGIVANNMIVGGERRGVFYNNYVVGISVWGNCHELLLSNNNIFAIGQSAIGLEYSTRVRVEGNKITNGADAIILNNCVNCQIVNNDIQQIDGSIQGNNRIAEINACNRNLIYNNYCGPAAQQAAEGALAPGIVLTGVDSIGDHTDNKIAAFVESISPTNGAVGDPVVITGTTFYNVTAVLFGDTRAMFIVDSLTQISTSVPIGATSGPIKIRSYAGLCIGPSFTVI